MKINIIGDIAGRFDELMELLNKMPAADLVLSVGDLIDRGPKSPQCVEWFMSDPIGRESLLGNHEIMMIRSYAQYPSRGWHNDIWFSNGGEQTYDQYVASDHWTQRLGDHLKWLRQRPLWFKTDGLFVSHAPLQYAGSRGWYVPANVLDWEREEAFTWSRYTTVLPYEDRLCVYGHNSSLRESIYVDDQGQQRITHQCIDNSRYRQLVGMHWPTKELYSVDYHS